MSQHFQTWVDGHLAVRHRAYETRGSITLDSGARWPRTTGNDVIATAAVVDPVIRQYGTPGILRRWRAVCADIASDGVAAASDTFPGNRDFWATFEAVAVFLDDVVAPSPKDSLWSALLVELGTRRNVGPSGDGPIARFDNIKTYDDLYQAQITFLREKRGADKLDPPSGFSGTARLIPRTTNADVLQLATYWTNQLGAVRHTLNHDSVVAEWQVALKDVDAFAKPGAPGDVYPKNNELWRVMWHVAVQVAVSDEALTPWDMTVDSVKDSVLHLPDTISDVASKGAALVEGAAHAAGKIANEAGQGLFSGLGAPVLIGAGLIGLFLVSRGRDPQAKEA